MTVVRQCKIHLNTMRLCVTAIALSVAALCGPLSQAHAGFIIQPIDATVIDDDGRETVTLIDVSNLHSGRGISEPRLVETGAPEPVAYPSHTELTALGSSDVTEFHWHADIGELTPTITFDLGSIFELESFRVWNFNVVDTSPPTSLDNTDRGAQSVDVSLSTDNMTFDSTRNMTFARASGAGETGESFSLTGSARYVRFDILSNYGDPEFTGLSEVRFVTVPEPATATLLVVGGAVIARRRRR